MNPFTTVIFFAWLPAAIFLFWLLKPRQGLIVVATATFLFMPMGLVEMPLMPYTKTTAVCINLLLAALLTNAPGLFSFKPKWVDLPMALFISMPMITGSLEGFAAYDCFAAALGHLVVFGTPYLLGRIYLGDVFRLRKLALAIFIGGLCYIPFCIFEMKMGPETHNLLYGFYPFPDYLQEVRAGGFRPAVFMQHGLMLGMYMSAATLCGWWLWRRKAAPKKILGLPTGIWVGLLAIVTVLCRSTGSLALMAIGMGVLFLTRRFRTYALVFVLAGVPVAYVVARAGLNWDGSNLAAVIEEYLGKDRADSLRTRFGSETIIVTKALEKPYLGWGPENAGLPKDDKGNLTAIPDGMWEATLSSWGWVGLAAIFSVMLLPAILLARRFPAQTWSHPAMAAPAALAVLALIYAVDNLMNNMHDPLFYLAMGGVTGLAVSKQPIMRRHGPMRRRGRKVKAVTSTPVAPSAPSAQPAPPVAANPSASPRPDPVLEDFLAPGVLKGVE